MISALFQLILSEPWNQGLTILFFRKGFWSFSSRSADSSVKESQLLLLGLSLLSICWNLMSESWIVASLRWRVFYQREMSNLFLALHPSFASISRLLFSCILSFKFQFGTLAVVCKRCKFHIQRSCLINSQGFLFLCPRLDFLFLPQQNPYHTLLNSVYFPCLNLTCQYSDRIALVYEEFWFWDLEPLLCCSIS